ncbi:MAG: CDP-diacylglycerol--glycerol-3-phosphate 3-phosphatidyltransferase [Planctomycetota bacterium]
MSTQPTTHTRSATGWRLHTPNAIVGLRLALAVGVIVLLAGHDPVRPTAMAWAAALFAIAAVTDALDGFLARRWNAITRFGRVMDPFADKILVLGAFVLLAGPAFVAGGTPTAGFTGWMVVAILARELLITSLRGLIEASGADFSAQTAGKLKMIAQSVAVPAVLLNIGLDPFDDLLAAGDSTGRLVNDAIAWATTAITVLSGVPYLLAAARQSRTPNP